MIQNRKNLIVIAVVIIITGLFYTGTVREGHNWGGDFSMYIHHAMNIAEGKEYDDTGYIQNPSFKLFAPKTYPPVFPAMLVPVCRSRGLDLKYMKILNIFIFLIFLLVMYHFFRERLPFRYLSVMITLVAFNPYFWQFKDNVLSEIPFLFCTYLALLLISLKGRFDRPVGRGLVFSVITGVVFYLAYGTRSIGVVLVPSLVIFELISKRKIPVSSIVSIAVFLILMVFQIRTLHSDSSYFDQMSFNIGDILNNTLRYIKSLRELWVNGYSRAFSVVLSLAFLGGAITGFVRNPFFGGVDRDGKIKKDFHPGIMEIFLLLYIIPLLIFPGYGGSRYIMPLIPIYIFYAFSGFRYLFQVTGKEKLGISILIAGLFITYSGAYSKADFGPIDEGPERSASIELFDYIRTETEADDIIIFGKPRVLSLYTGRAAAVYHELSDPEDLLLWAHEINAEYLLVGPFERDRDILLPAVKSLGPYLERVFLNEDFEMLRIVDFPR